jgi:hypothetical protein
LLAPILPHTADEAWRSLHGYGDDAPEHSVHTQSFALAAVQQAPLADNGWPVVFTMRHAAHQAIEAHTLAGGASNLLDLGLVIPDPTGILQRFDLVDLADLCGVSRLTLVPAMPSPTVTDLQVIDLRHAPRCERSWRRDETVHRRSNGAWLSDRDALALGLAEETP